MMANRILLAIMNSRLICRMVITILIGLIAGTSSDDTTDYDALYDCVNKYHIRYVAFATEYKDVGLRQYIAKRDDPFSLEFARHIAPVLRCPMNDPEKWQPVDEIFPAVAIIDNTTLTDVYVYANGTCHATSSCFDDFSILSMLIDVFLAVMPRSYLGYELPTVKGKNFKLDDEVMSTECLDPRGYRTRPLGKTKSCYAFYQMNAGRSAQFSAGRLLINNVAQSTLVLGRSSALRVFYESDRFCKIINDFSVKKEGRKCESFVTGSNYALLCCCYTQASECYLPNNISYSYKPKLEIRENPTTYSCAIGRTVLPYLFDNEDQKTVTWLENLILSEDNSLTLNSTTIESYNLFANKHVANGNACVATLTYNYSKVDEQQNHLYDVVVDFKPQKNRCKRTTRYGSCTPMWKGSESTEMCPNDKNFDIKSYKMECCCSDMHLCNVNFLFDISEFFRQRFRGLQPDTVAVRPRRRMINCYYATDIISAFQSTEDAEDTYMCSVFYDPFSDKTLTMYDGFNARIHFDPEAAWAREETSLILVSFPNCSSYLDVIPIFVASCGPPGGEPSEYEKCDVKLKENIIEIYNAARFKFDRCPVISGLTVNGNQDEVNGLLARLEKMTDSEMAESTLFCYMTVQSEHNATSKQMTHKIYAGAVNKNSQIWKDCAILMENNKDEMRGHRFCVLWHSYTTCCCFIGVGFQSCKIKEIISEVVISNNYIVVSKMERSKAEHESGALSCATSYNAAKVTNVSGNCMQRQGCYRIYNFGRTAMEFQLWAGCTSNIPQESFKASIMSFTAYCRSKDPARQDAQNRPVEYEYDALTRWDWKDDLSAAEEDKKHVIQRCYAVKLDSLLYSPNNPFGNNDDDSEGLPKMSSNLTQLCCCYYGSCSDTLPNNWGYKISDEI